MGNKKFSRGLKRSICIEYMQSGKSRKEIAMKYGLPSTNLLSAWIQSCLSPWKFTKNVHLCLVKPYKWMMRCQKRRRIA